MKHKFSGFWRRAKEILLSASSSQAERHSHRGRSLGYEPLEPRIVLAAAGLVDSVAQPMGALDGKIVFTSAGHGVEWNSVLMRFDAGREEFGSTEVNEAFGNQDQLFFFAEHLLRAGATVVPMRPIGHQLNEVVLDNDSAEVTYTGSWSDSTSSVYYDEDYGAVADSVSYRFASISATETATATYMPNIPEAGFYPVYTWVLDSSNRTNQLYRINDSAGGVTEIRVDHRQVGKGWVYLGTYHFDAGTSGSVVISNQSTDGGSNVIADAIRFGNGMGDLPDGPNGIGHPSGSLSGAPREDEAALQWTWRAIGQGNSAASVVGTSHVSAPQRMADHMNSNSNPFGTSVYIGFHSNASGAHTARGAVGLFTNSASLRTPNQEDLALFTGRQINQDMQALNGLFEHNWGTTTTHTYNGINFGEIDGGPGAEMDQTIIEVAYHDQVQDANLLNDPKVRDQLARSTYEAVIEYFSNFGGLADTTSLPSAPTGATATTNAGGDITVSWEPGPTGVQGGTPTAYRIYVSRDGYGYLGYDEVAGAGSGSHTFTSAELDNDPYYFKVVAVNSGGESPRSLVAAAQKPEPSENRLLIVNGFDRNDRSLNERYPDPFSNDPDGLDLVDRVRPRYNNTFDYSIQVAEAIAASTTGLGIDTSSNEAVIAGDVNLGDYAAVFWILGEESSGDSTFDVTEQGLVSGYLGVGGQLFVSGAEVGWDLDNLGNGQSFYNNSLRADYVADDAATYDVQGVGGSIFDGLSFSFDDGSQFYDVNFPDVISPLGGATTALNYVGGTGGGAAIQFDSGGSTKVVNLAFPFETITDQADRNDVMSRVLSFFSFDVTFSDFEAILDNDDGAPIYTETGSWTTVDNGLAYNGLTYRFTPAGGSPATAQWQFTAPFAGQGEVEVIYSAGSNRTSSTAYQIDTGSGVELANINQKINDLTWVSLGTFDFTAGSHTVLLDAQASSGGSVVVADAVRVFIAAPITETGDFDSNGSVNGFDFLAWQRGFGTTGGATLPQGDGNADGNVDDADLAIWESQYGTTTLQGATLQAATLLAASESFSAGLTLTATAEPTPAASPAPLKSGAPAKSASPAALASVAQFVSLSDEKLQSSSAGVVESTEYVQNFGREHRRSKVQDAIYDLQASLLERIRTRPEPTDYDLTGHDPTDYDHGAWQEAFAEIGEDELFDSHLLEM